MISTHPGWSRIAKSPFWGIAVLLVWCAPVAAQISPGPLSQAHRQLEGVTRCAACHDLRAGSRGLKCLACHTEIQRRLDARAGFHSRVVGSSAGQTDCRRCHMEHNGQKFALIRLDRKGFDHQAQTGFALSGRHRTLECASCHNATHVSADARGEIKLTDLNRSFLGLRRECTSCHEDRHRGQLGSECARCHAQEAWKPVPGFSHAGTHFPLTGMHQTVSCRKCHAPRAGETVAAFKGLAFRGCQDCHADPHRGAFQKGGQRSACDGCHSTNGWKNNRPSTSFNHNTTPFPLSGKHAGLSCSNCHVGGDFRRPIAHEHCRDCHQDPHNGQFDTRRAGSDCSACHSNAGFKPSRFDRETHTQSAFPLEGKHASLACVKCHKPAEGGGVIYKTGKLTCPACHADPHGGEFAAAPHANKCDECHTPEGFRPTTFSVARHAQTRFALTGRHVSVACDDCHSPLTPPANGAVPERAARRFHFASMSCGACHTDPHETRVTCETCHAPEQWPAVRPFDHSTTGFKIEGAHRNLECIQCHSPSGGARAGEAGMTPRFSNTPGQCSGCHETKNVHGSQFMREPPREDCSACHAPVRWNSGDFNHDRAAFALDVAHRRVACVKCHKEQRDAGGRMIRLYRGTPKDCVKCH